VSPKTDLVAKWYVAISSRDWDTLRAITDPAIDFTVADGFPAGGKYQGKDAVFDDFFPRSFQEWSQFTTEVDEIIEAQEHNVVTVRGRYVGRTLRTNTSFDVPFAHIWRVGEGHQLIWLQQYADTAVMRDAILGAPTEP